MVVAVLVEVAAVESLNELSKPLKGKVVMARRVYFAFHYDDVASFRANVVRNSWVTQANRELSGFYDASLWEQAKKQGDMGIKRMINTGLNLTTVTAVLVGAETYARRWVRYEIIKSFERGNGLLGININQIKGKDQAVAPAGPNPFDYFYFRVNPYGNVDVFEYEVGIGQWIPCIDLPSMSRTALSYPAGTLAEGRFSQMFPVYDWVAGDGYSNLGAWVETAASSAGK